jgi:hypothetical protein
LTQEAASLGGDPDETRWYSGGVARWSLDHPSRFFCINDHDEGEDEHKENISTRIREEDESESEKEYSDQTFFWTSPKGDHQYAIKHISTLGLPFLSNLFNNPDPRSRRSVVMEAFFPHPCFIPNFLLDTANPFRKEEQVRTFERGMTENPNLGWLWANQYPQTPQCCLACDFGFRSRGYVFWDRARLAHLEVTEEFFSQMSRRWTLKRRDRATEKSVEQRLEEMGIIQERSEPSD